ncbi:MAG: YebC/PmpR family DNA-binding transcriptional regulator [Clostridiales bacterium]|nr:YebC/PmpR family DNA-binding transcriptional regulator [Clostridiales bacterium]
MSGHSKWSTIKRKKEKTDGQRAKIFTKLGREMAVAIKEGGPDPNNNGKLREIIAKAKANNVPNDNIDRAIKKAAADSDKGDFFEITYEGYGLNGIAVMVEALTDNRNRTAADVRHYFDKYGSGLGQSGCVSFLFEQKGVLVIEDESLTEEKLMDDCLEVGAEDFSIGDGVAEITTTPEEFQAVRDGLIEKGYHFTSAEIEYVPSTTIRLTDEESVGKMQKLLELLEDNDDVQNVWHNWELPDEE